MEPRRKRLGAQPAQREKVAQRDLVAEHLAVQRLRARGQHEQQAARAQRREQRVEKLAREKTAVGIGGRIAELVQRKFVQLRQETEHDGDQADHRGAPPAHVVTAHPQHDRDHHAGHQHQRHRGIDRRGDFVLGPQALIVALPLLGNLEVLAIAAHLVAQHRDLEAIGGVVQLEIAFLPGEGAVYAMRARHVGGLDEIQRGGVAPQARAQEIFRQRARLRRGGGGPRGIFGQFVFEARQLAQRRDLDVVLFLLRAGGTSGTPIARDARACP